MGFDMICVVIGALFFGLSLVYYFTQLNRYKKIQKYEQEIADPKVTKYPNVPERIVDAIIRLSDRKFRYIQNYFLFLMTNKVFGLVSITYSILGLISLNMKEAECSKMLGYVICFISIIFVILALYLTPVSKVYQYISAWRICDEKMCEVLASEDYYSTLQDKKVIKETAESISAVIAKAEELLTTEGE